MTAFDIRLDPVEVAINRTELQINTGAIVADEAGIDWGDGAIQAYLSDARVGSIPVGRRWPNRIVKIPLIVASPANTATYATAKHQIMQKVAQIQREGVGWLKRQTGLYADVIDATLTYPDRYGERFGWENGVVLQLECSPDFYADEVVLDSISATNGVVSSVLKLSGATAAIVGAQDARSRIIITDTSGHDQNGAWWGVRSQYYDSATTAKTFYEAEALTMINGSSAHTHSGMSNGTTVMNSGLAADQWMSILVTDLAAGTKLTHRGSYRVIARAYSATAAPSLRLQWGTGVAATYVTNASIALPGSGSAYELDLGVIRVDLPPVGNLAWRGVIEAYAANTNDPIEIDRLVLVPVAEAAGELNVAPFVPVGAIQASANPTAASSTGSGTAWTTVTVSGLIEARVTLNNSTSQLMQMTAFGFAIPSGATIQGVAVVAERYADGTVADVTVKLLKASTAVGNNKASAAAWANSLTNVTYGGTSDLWGTTIAASDVNNSGFGVEFSAVATGGAAFAELLVGIAVYYTIGTAFGSTANRVIYASKTLEVRTEGAFNTTDGTVYNELVCDGDLPRIPASGLEARPCELTVVTSEGNLISQTGDSYIQPSTALDGFSAQVKYRPSWPFAP